MNSFPLTAPAANTRVCRALVIGGWEVMECEDDQRHQQPNTSLSQAPVDVAGRQEVGSDTLGDDPEKDLTSDDPGLCKQRDKASKFNGSGRGLATRGASPSQRPAFATTSANATRTVRPPVQAPVGWGWAGITSKGCLQGTFWIAPDASDQIPADPPVAMGAVHHAHAHQRQCSCSEPALWLPVVCECDHPGPVGEPGGDSVCTGDLSALAAGSNPDASARQQHDMDDVQSILMQDARLTDACSASGQNGFPVVGLDVSDHRPSLKAGLQVTTT